MRTTANRAAAILVTSVFLGWGGLEEEAGGTRRGAIEGGAPGNPTLFEVRQQCSEIAAFFPVDLALARRWVPRAFDLAVDGQGNASGALILMNCPDYFSLTTPNSPPLRRGQNIAPGSVVHLWFMLRGRAQVLPVPGAQATGPTQYAYAVADLVTSPSAERVYRRAGKNAVLISRTTLVDDGRGQTGKIVFTNGSTITLRAHTPAQLPTPLRLGGNVWNWHVADPALVGPSADDSGHVNTTRVMFLGTVPGPPNTTRVTLHAEPGTLFADYYGTSEVVAARATFFRPNNIVNNSSRGALAWTTYPPQAVNCPPLPPQ
jgi:hypothetical protein